MVKTAIILAAGMGTRLRDMHELPKGFLPIDGKPIIQRSVEQLLAIGIETIIIGTGYKHEHYDAFASQYPQIQCIENPDYDTTGPLDTLMICSQLLKEDQFLLIESDLYYETQCLWDLVHDSHDTLTLATPITDRGDEVFISYDDQFSLKELSKDASSLSRIDAVKIHMGKFHRSMLERMKPIISANPNRRYDYEEVMVAINTDDVIRVKYGDYLWGEVDMKQHYEYLCRDTLPKIKQKEQGVAVTRQRLFTPGPATTTDTVKQAQVVPDICPREAIFGDVMSDISDDLTAFVSQSGAYDTTLFSGSGTAAVEAMISSLPITEPVVIIENGAYGKRCSAIAEVYGLRCYRFQSSHTEPIDLEALAAFMSEHHCRYLVLVHHETSAGLLNDVEAIGALCRDMKVELLVDAMSSYGAIPLDCDAMGIHFLAASSNKNLQGIAGVSFVVHHKESIQKLESVTPKSYYLNLPQQYKFFKKNRQMQFTPPVQVLYALRQAIIETKLEGVEARYQRYISCWNVLSEGLRHLGLNMVVNPTYQSKLITAISDPEQSAYSFDALHHYCYQRNCSIYPGKLPELSTFRIATIGQLVPEDVMVLIGCMATFLNQDIPKLVVR